ncbi:hypothetical protein V8J88_08935 [Massilia sp. W12]|uniref:hypothetical protein n=1 Tax=Massilia sp. W12 TaxID=3126507 RepID=UPI0030CA6AB3
MQVRYQAALRPAKAKIIAAFFENPDFAHKKTVRADAATSHLALLPKPSGVFTPVTEHFRIAAIEVCAAARTYGFGRRDRHMRSAFLQAQKGSGVLPFCIFEFAFVVMLHML